jgi:ribosomal-protein-alanine N-acetyltransferase
MENLVIRSFGDEDTEIIEAVEVIEKESFSSPWADGSFEQLLKNPFVHGKYAVCDGEICGFIVYFSLFEDSEILDIAVKDQYRRRGIAKMLIDEMTESVLAMGATRMMLEVRQSNTGARGLYLSLGFKETGIRKNYYSKPREDAILMERTIE